MNYAKYYNKLDNIHYTTIREHRNGRVIGDIEPEKVKRKVIHYAKILKIEEKRLNELSTDFLCKDTDEASRNDALRILQSFHKRDIMHIPYWYIFYMEKLTPEEFNELKQEIKEIGIEDWLI